MPLGMSRAPNAVRSYWLPTNTNQTEETHNYVQRKRGRMGSQVHEITTDTEIVTPIRARGYWLLLIYPRRGFSISALTDLDLLPCFHGCNYNDHGYQDIC